MSYSRLPFFQKLQQIEGVWERLQAAAITILRQVFVDGNLRGAIWSFFSTMLDILGLPPQLVTQVIAKGAQALGDILNDPLGFLGNLLRAMKLGLEKFFNNIGTHLLGGLQGWLLGQLEGTGIEMPQDISFKSMLKLVFQVLGITVDMLLEILEEVTGRRGLKAKIQRVIGAISNAWDWFQRLITESKEGESFWDRLSNAVGSIWDFILDGVVGWLEQTIVNRALAWVAKKLDPTGVMAVITTIIDVFALFEAIMSKAREIFEMIERVLDRIGEIIKGLFPAAAEVLERAMAAAIPVAMAILAAVVGLGGAADTIKEEIEKLRQKIWNGIKRVITSIKDWILRLVGEGRDDGADTIAAALQEIDTEAERELDEGEVKQDEAEAIKNKVNLDHPQVIEISSVKDGGKTWDFEYQPIIQRAIVKKSKKTLLPGEGRVGTFGNLRRLGSSGDNLTPHHIPADKYMKQFGVARNDGICIMMEQPPQGGRHRRTRSYGGGPDLSESPNKALDADIADVREIYRQDNLLTSSIQASLSSVRRLNKITFPQVFTY